MAVLAFPAAADYHTDNLGNTNKEYYYFASVADGDTFTVKMTKPRTIAFISSDTTARSSSVVPGTSTAAGTPITIHVSGTGPGTIVAEGPN